MTTATTAPWVVVPTRRGDELLAGAVAALRGQGAGGLVVVCDGARPPGRARLARYRDAVGGPVRLVVHPRPRGFARAANAGVAATPPGVDVALLNDDARPRAAWLAALCRALADDPAVAAAGSVLVGPDGRVESAGDGLRAGGFAVKLGAGAPAPRLGGPPLDVPGASAAALLVRRAAWAEVGSFDAALVAYLEDVDWCRRARRRGWRVVVAPAAVADHAQGSTHRAAPRRSVLRIARNQILVAAGHADGPPTLRAAAVIARAHGADLLAWRRRGLGGPAAAGKALGVAALPWWLVTRRRGEAHASAHGRPPRAWR